MWLLEIFEGKKEIEDKSFFYEASKSELGRWPLYAIRNQRYKYIPTYKLNKPDKIDF